MEPSANPLVQLSEAFDFIGHPMYSDEFLGRVLAFACLSGFCEACVLNPALNAVLQIAQRRFKIMGGCVPDIEKMRQHWDNAMAELFEHGKDTPWLKPMMERYKITGWETLNFQEWAPEFKKRAQKLAEQGELFR